MDLAEAQRAVDRWISRFPDGYWPPLSNLARLVEEVGELARELNHRYGHKPKKSSEPEQDLALELADILFVVIAIANEQRVDLDDAFRRVLAKYQTRDGARWLPSEDDAEDDDDDGDDEDPPGRGAQRGPDAAEAQQRQHDQHDRDQQ